MTDSADDVRQKFSNKVTEYGAARPDYPAALLDQLVSLRDSASVDFNDFQVADLGAGTGILTRALLDRGFNVTAVEPNAAMRAAADAALSRYPRYQSIPGSAEATSLERESVDLITAAQAFHWFDVDQSRREALRILKPHGQVALIWNDRVLTDPLQADLEKVFTDFGGDQRRAVRAREDRSSITKFFGLGVMLRWTYPHEQRLTRDGLSHLALSRSYMPARDTAAGQHAIEQVSELFERHADGGFVALRYQTVMSVGRPA